VPVLELLTNVPNPVTPSVPASVVAPATPSVPVLEDATRKVVPPTNRSEVFD
jgi:hypothetical protein